MNQPWHKRFRKLLPGHRTRPDSPTAQAVPNLFLPSHRQASEATISECIDSSDCSITSLNIEAAKHQATICKYYIRDKTNQNRQDELPEGKVPLPPHKTWTGDYTDWV